MPARDKFHDAVRNALQKEGWTITHDPYFVKYENQKLMIDLGAEAPIAAEKAERKIAVEVKSFLHLSPITNLYDAIGQYLIYRQLLRRQDAERKLYLAVPITAYSGLLDNETGRELLAEEKLRVIVFDADEEVVTLWIE